MKLLSSVLIGFCLLSGCAEEAPPEVPTKRYKSTYSFLKCNFPEVVKTEGRVLVEIEYSKWENSEGEIDTLDIADMSIWKVPDMQSEDWFYPRTYYLTSSPDSMFSSSSPDYFDGIYREPRYGREGSSIRIDRQTLEVYKIDDSDGNRTSLGNCEVVSDGEYKSLYKTYSAEQDKHNDYVREIRAKRERERLDKRVI